MKILFFSHEYPPFGGGAGRVAEANVKKLSDKGVEVDLLSRNLSQFSDVKLHIKVWYVPKIYQIFYFFKFRKLNFEKYDLIILNDMTSIYLAGVFFPKKVLSKSICFLHGSEPEKIVYFPNLEFKFLKYHFFFSRVLCNCKNIIAVSSFMRNKFISAFGKEYENKTNIIRSPINEIFLNEKLVLNDKAAEQNIKLITVSRLDKGKGIDKMIAAFKKVVDCNKDIFWSIVGSGDQEIELKKLVSDLGLDTQINFLGRKSQSDIACLYRESHLFWLLSDLKESFGLVYLESQYCGCPVIGYKKHGVTEAVIDRKSNHLVDSIDEAVNIILAKNYLNVNRNQISRSAKESGYQDEFINYIQTLMSNN